MRMGSYFVEIYATKILPVFLYIPHHRTSGFWKCLSRHVWAENPLFFQGKKLLPDVGIFRKISRIRKQPGFDVLFLLCICVCVFFFFVCFFLRARAELFGTRPSIKQKKKCAYPKPRFTKKRKKEKKIRQKASWKCRYLYERRQHSGLFPESTGVRTPVRVFF